MYIEATKALRFLISLYGFSKIVPWLYKYLYSLYTYSQIPGPRNIPFLGSIIKQLSDRSSIMTLLYFLNTKVLFIFFKEYAKTLIEISNEHANEPFFKQWSGPCAFLIFHKFDNLDILFGGSKNNEKAFHYKFFHQWLGNSLLISGGEQWSLRRKLLTPSFHFDILKSYLQTINEEADVLVEQLMKQDFSRDIHLLPFLSAFTLDSICSTAMGENVNAQLNHDSNYVKSVQKMLEIVNRRKRTPWLWNDFIFSLTNLSKLQNDCLKTIHEFTKNVIKKRAEGFFGLSNENRRVSFLDTLLNARLQSPDSFTYENIQEEVDLFMFAGHDTTATALNWTLFAIATHPNIQKKIHQEISEVFGSSSSNIFDENLKRLEYIDCVIKESLRLYPPAPLISREITEDMILNGKRILQGTQATVFIYQIHRDERVFSQPKKFNPDRFLVKNSINRHPYGYIPFSAGKRNCIGQKLALMELKVALVKLLQRFEFQCDQKEEELNFVFESILRTEQKILFRLKKKTIF